MGFDSRYRTAALSSLAVTALAALHLAYEHSNGGVVSHHLLARPDLPLISNWLELAVLPVLGWLFGWRLHGRSAAGSPTRAGAPRSFWFAAGGAFAYGALLAGGFEFGVSDLTSALFYGLFLIAVALPVYRVEFLLGFVLGMTFTFGGVLPALIGAVFGLISLGVRLVARAVVWAARSVGRPTGGAR
ncbi:hypothetical protein [Arenimonas sp.]|uniref:hypothetical protein n=1 Tax=Arenimonas sp. TaxID=1872635 RepID=UPI002E32BE21|nr:hypothetical protein [Arenimonas sp.]HEX4854253.1 hypothetical protein [Arenimonas sp.]